MIHAFLGFLNNRICDLGSVLSVPIVASLAVGVYLKYRDTNND
jgi:hypothetical protein